MNSSAQDKTVQTAAGQPLARLGSNHGYRIEGDTVSLNAMFTVLSPAAHQQTWTLQLWASPVSPRIASEVGGHLIAEVALPPIGEVADDIENFEISTFASAPPNSRTGHAMVLALVSNSAGRAVEVQDFAVYPRNEFFPQPRITGNAGYRIEGNRVTIDVERIENPRNSGNLSGTLALELWALNGPYQGGAFAGVPLSGVAFDALTGEHEYRHCSFNLPFTPPPSGNWSIVLMLREWTNRGYQTRDFVNFPQPMIIAPLTVVDAPSIAKATPEANAPTTPALPIAPAAPANRLESRTGRTVVTIPTPSPAPKAAVATPQAAAPKATAKDRTISVNTASKAELTTLKGLPSKVADEIVARRPFRSLDDLLKVKGMGAKLLANLRSKLRL